VTAGRSLTRLAVVPAGLPVAVALAVVPLPGSGLALRPLGFLGAVAVVAYGAAVALPWPAVLPWALGLLAVEYLAALALRQAPPASTAPVYAAAYFLCAELGWLGLEARQGLGPWVGRVLAVAALAAAGAALGSLLLAAAALPVSGGAPLTALGVAAAVAAAACLAWLVRR